jgi:hypothetical protein
MLLLLAMFLLATILLAKLARRALNRRALARRLILDRRCLAGVWAALASVSVAEVLISLLALMSMTTEKSADHSSKAASGTTTRLSRAALLSAILLLSTGWLASS